MASVQGKKTHTQLFHIVKRGNGAIPMSRAIAVRVIAVISALIVSGIVIMLLTGKNPLDIYRSMVLGAFGTSRRILNLFQGIAILLCISLAVTPAFKMRFWNCGAEGQALMGGLATVLCMIFFGNKLPLWALILVMLAASIVAGIIWAVIPAIFKAFFNTNETLFTLMMNYVAIQVVAYFLKTYVKSGSGVLSPMMDYGFPYLFGQPYIMNIIIVAVLTAVVYVYLKYSKQGYEISVVGESENTARYIGINVKKVIIRTLAVSGALAGVTGLLLVAGTSHTIDTKTVGGQGFTAIMVSWLAKFDPLFMVLTSFLVVFLEKGAAQVSTDYRLPSSISDIVTGIILLFIIGCEFFLTYKIVFAKKEKEEK